MTLKLAALFYSLAAEFPTAKLIGQPDLLIETLSPLENASPQAMSFLSHPKYSQKLAQSKAACVVVGPLAESAAALRGTCIDVASIFA